MSNQKIPSLEQVRRELAKRSFYDFTRIFWEEMDPDSFIDAWYLQCMAEHLQAVYEGEIPNLVINIPPGMGKSILGSVAFPAWCWVQDPTYSLMCLTRDGGNLKRDAFKFFNLVKSKKFQSYYGDLFQVGQTDKDSKVSEDYKEIQTDKKGYRRALTTGSATTGARGKIILLDDPNDRTEVHSDIKRKGTNDYVFNTLSTRNFSKRGGAMVIIMQRLHQEDVAGVAIEKGFEHLKLPMEACGKSVFSLPGWKDKRKKGQYLNPELFDKSSKEDMLTKLSLLEYTGQYQQEPSIEDGNMIKREWIKRYHRRPERFHELIQVWDMNFKAGDKTDFVVGQVWGRINSDKYLLDQIRGRYSFTETLNAVRELTRRNPDAIIKMVEDKANGPAVIDSLQSEIGGFVEYNPKDSKEARLSAVAPEFEGGNVHYPETSIAPWVKDTLDELFTFPNGSHDDTVDTTTMALLRFRNSGAALLSNLTNM